MDPALEVTQCQSILMKNAVEEKSTNTLTLKTLESSTSWRCDGCIKEFQSNYDLKRHLSCSNCGQEFSTGRLLHEHMRAESGCPITLMKAKRTVIVLVHRTKKKKNIMEVVDQSMEKLGSKPLVCDGCMDTFLSIEELKKHLTCHCNLQFVDAQHYHLHEPECKVYECNGCYHVFHSDQSLKRHFTCHCNAQFPDGHDYHAHVSQCQLHRCEGCLKTFESSGQKEEHLTCDCGSKFIEGEFYHIHERVCTKVKCHICHETCQSSSALSLHFKSIHYLRCFGCYEVFYSKAAIESHMTCSVCGRQFRHGVTFHRHADTGTCKFVICVGCEEKFPSKKLLMQHMKCSVCGRQFKYGGTFHRHTDSCKFVACGGCEETFPSKELLLHHMICTVCDCEFKHGTAFHRHAETCKFVTCGGCEEKFVSRVLLMLHLKCTVCGRQLLSGVRFHKHAETCSGAGRSGDVVDLSANMMNSVLEVASTETVDVKNYVPYSTTPGCNSAVTSSSDEFFVQVKLEPVDMDEHMIVDAIKVEVPERDPLVKEEKVVGTDAATADLFGNKSSKLEIG